MLKHRLGFGAWAAALPLSLLISHTAAADPAPELLPNRPGHHAGGGARSHFSPLNPGVAANPNYVVGQAVTTRSAPTARRCW